MTSSNVVLTVLHPGRMGAAVGREAKRGGARVLWCEAGRSPATRERALAAGLEPVADLASAVEASEIIISVCPPAAAEDVAAHVADLGYSGLYLEANAISPEKACRIAERLERSGAQVLDGGIIGPPPTQEERARLYLSGADEGVAKVVKVFSGTCLEPVSVGRRLGAASALKMAFASFQKASRALAAVAHALAEDYGVAGELRAEAQRMPGDILADVGYLPSVAARAWRWAPEMREVARTLRSCGLPGDLALAAAAVLERWQGDKDRYDLPLSEVFAHLHQAG